MALSNHQIHISEPLRMRLRDPGQENEGIPDSFDSNKNRIKRMLSLIRHPLLSIYRLDGTFDDEKLSVIVADDGATLEYIQRLLFPHGASRKKIGAISALQAHTLINSTADIVIVGANLNLRDNFTNSGFHLIPKWLCLYLPVSEDPDERIESFDRATRKYFRRLVRKMDESGFSCEVTTDPEWLETFYRDMYTPYARNRHGENAIIHPKSKIQKAFDKGGGVIVKKNDEMVGGVIIYRKGPILYMPHVGILNGDVALARDGATSSLDYCVVHLSHFLKCKYMHFGHTRPFLSDGVLLYKLNWHMEVRQDDDGISAFAVATPGNTSIAQDVLRSHPYFYLSGNEVRLFDDPMEETQDSEVQEEAIETKWNQAED